MRIALPRLWVGINIFFFFFLLWPLDLPVKPKSKRVNSVAVKSAESDEMCCWVGAGE